MWLSNRRNESCRNYQKRAEVYRHDGHHCTRIPKTATHRQGPQGVAPTLPAAPKAWQLPEGTRQPLPPKSWTPLPYVWMEVRWPDDK